MLCGAGIAHPSRELYTDGPNVFGGEFALFYLIATVPVLVGAGFVAALWPGLRSALDRILAWFVLVPALITLVALGLGLAGLLTPAALAGAQWLLAAAAFAAWWAIRLRRGAEGEPPSRAGNAVRRLWEAALPARRALRSPWLWPLLLAGAIAVGWLLYVGLLVPPYGWDVISYHLPSAVWWLQAGRIYPAPTQFQWGYAYPQGWTLLQLWQLAFTATDRLTNIIELPFYLMGILAAYGLAREGGIGRRWAPWAAAFWALAPVALSQLTVSYNDVAVAALTLTVLYFVIRTWRSNAGYGPLTLAGIAAGLLLGVKANGALVLGFAGLMAMLPAVRPWRRYGLAIIGRWSALTLPALVIGGYWYVRDLVLYHNPVYPIRVTLLGHQLFPGPFTVQTLLRVTAEMPQWKLVALGLNEYALRYSWDTPTAGFGPVFTCLGAGAILALCLHAWRTRRWRLLLLMAAGLLLFLLQPFKYPRYYLFLPAFAGIAFGYVLQHLAGRWGRRVMQAAAVALMLFSLVLLPAQPQLTPESIWQLRTAARQGRSLASVDFGFARDYAFIDAVPELDQPDTRIAYTETGFVYPLMGRQRNRTLYYVPHTTYEEWLQGLMQKRTTFLIVGADDAWENGWAKFHPDRFVPWARSQPFTVYLIKSDEPRNQALLMRGPAHD